MGYIAGFLTTISTLPQILRVYKLKSAREISILFNILLLAGVVLWLIYGALLGLLPLIIWNAIALVLIGLLLGAKLKYGR